LYTVVIEGGNYILQKSVDYGDSFSPVWTSNEEIVAIATSPTEPDVVYIATAYGVYKSSDGGITFGQPIQSPGVVTCLDVYPLQMNFYVIIIGTSEVDAADVWSWNELSLSWSPIGFNAAMENIYSLSSGLDKILAVACASESDSTGGVVAIGNEVGSATTVVSYYANSAWGGNASYNADAIYNSEATTGDIAFADNYNVAGISDFAFYFGINDTDTMVDTSGIYKFKTGPNTITRISQEAQVVTLDVMYDMPNARIIAGLTDGTVIRSLDGGVTWPTVSDQPTGSDFAYVLFNRRAFGPPGWYTLVRCHNGGLHQSYNQGNTWALIWP